MVSSGEWVSSISEFVVLLSCLSFTTCSRCNFLAQSFSKPILTRWTSPGTHHQLLLYTAAHLPPLFYSVLTWLKYWFLRMGKKYICKMEQLCHSNKSECDFLLQPFVFTIYCLADHSDHLSQFIYRNPRLSFSVLNLNCLNVIYPIL